METKINQIRFEANCGKRLSFMKEDLLAFELAHKIYGRPAHGAHLAHEGSTCLTITLKLAALTP